MCLLFNPCSPSDIPRLVVAVVLDPVKGVLWRWPRAHRGEKRVEGDQPLIAHTNAAAAVMLEAHHVRIQATLFHRRPDPIFDWMRMVSAPPRTAARCRQVMHETMKTNDALPAAIASTAHHTKATAPDRVSEYSQPSKSLPPEAVLIGVHWRSGLA